MRGFVGDVLSTGRAIGIGAGGVHTAEESGGRLLRKPVDEARDKVEKRPEQAMCSYTTQRTHSKAAVDARDTSNERFGVLGVRP